MAPSSICGASAGHGSGSKILKPAPKHAETTGVGFMILSTGAAWVGVGVILRIVLDDICLDASVCPYCKASIGEKTRICAHCHRALGKR